MTSTDRWALPVYLDVKLVSVVLDSAIVLAALLLGRDGVEKLALRESIKREGVCGDRVSDELDFASHESVYRHRSK